MSAATHYLFARNAMSPMPTLLSVDALDFGYPQCNVFQGFSLRCNAGLVLLCGDESTGKTTLLRLLAGELAAQKGAWQWVVWMLCSSQGATAPRFFGWTRARMN